MRLSGENFAKPVIVTGSDFRFVVTEQLLAEGIKPGAILIEPDGRNTAPAILAAALHIAASDPDGLMLVAPSDHAIVDTAGFRATVLRGVAAARAGQIVTFGILPTRAETGYGWLELEQAVAEDDIPLKRFVEKPNAQRAAATLEGQGFLWNAGIFLFSARTIISAFAAHAPALLAPVRAALDMAQTDLGFLRLDPGEWSKVDPISIDYAVMERATNLVVVPFHGAWTDLGGWDAVATEMDTDASGNSLSGAASAIECEGSLLRSESTGVELVGIGLSNIIAVAMDDAVLVADRSRAQDVKKAVEVLKAKGAKQAEAFSTDHRPWGWFETLALADRREAGCRA